MPKFRGSDVALYLINLDPSRHARRAPPLLLLPRLPRLRGSYLVIGPPVASYLLAHGRRHRHRTCRLRVHEPRQVG